MYTDLIIREANSPGRAAAMWWSRALSNRRLKNGLTPDQLKTFEDELARSIDKALTTPLFSRTTGRHTPMLLIVFIPGATYAIASDHLMNALKKISVDYKTLNWPAVPEIRVSKRTVWRYDTRGTYRVVWENHTE